MKIKHPNHSFTIVEMVIILSIIGVLLSLSFKGIQSLREASSKTKAITSLKAIAEAYRQYMEDQGHPIRWKDLDKVQAGASGYDVTLIAAVLAKEGYLNAVEAWAWDFDYRVKKYCATGNAMPQKICDITRDGSGTITSAKVNLGFRGKNGFPVSVCAAVAANQCVNDDFLGNPGEIPIAYTRGLRDGTTNPGTWGNSSVNFDLGGVFEAKGGFIAFLDGHVEWYENLGSGDRCALRKYDTHTLTNKIYEALPNGNNSNGGDPSKTLTLSWKGGVWDCGDF